MNYLKRAIAFVRAALADPAEVNKAELTELMQLCQQLYGREFERNGGRHLEVEE